MIGQPIDMSVSSAGLVATITMRDFRARARSIRICRPKYVLPLPVWPRISTCSGITLPRGRPQARRKSRPTSDHGARVIEPSAGASERGVGAVVGDGCTTGNLLLHRLGHVVRPHDRDD